MLPFREIDVMGVFVAPFVLCLLLAIAGTLGLIAVLGRVPFYARSTHRPLIELGLFTGMLSTFVLLLGRG
jgi:hypothetical protein